MRLLRIIPISCILSLMILGLSDLSHATEAIRLDLETCINLALEKNRQIKSAREDVKKAYAQIDENRASAWPQLDATADYTRQSEADPFNVGVSLIPENNYKLDLKLKQKIYAPEVFEAIRASRSYAKAAEMSFEVQKEAAVTAVKKAYYLYIFSKEMIEVSEEAVKQLERHVEDVEKRVNVGLATDFDLLRAEVRLANAMPEFTRARNDLLIAGEELKMAVGIGQAEEIETNALLLYLPSEMTLQLAIDTAISKRPELSLMDYRIDTLDRYVEVTKKGFQPTLSLQGNYSYAKTAGGFAWDDSWNVGLKLEYKIFDGWRRSSRVTQNRIEVSKATIEKKTAIDSILLEVKISFSRLKEAEELISSQEKNIKNALRAYEIAEIGNRSGVITELELLDAQFDLTEAKSNYKRAVYDWLTAKTDLEKAMGMAAEYGPGEAN